jgi:hypothetical protein
MPEAQLVGTEAIGLTLCHMNKFKEGFQGKGTAGQKQNLKTSR